MLTPDALLQHTDRPRRPEPVRIAVVALPLVILLDLVAGLLGGFTLLAVDLANEAGGRTVVLAGASAAVLAVAFWHTVVWLIARIVLTIGIAKGRPWARTAAFAVEGLAIAVWGAVLTVRIADGEGVDIGGGPLEALRGFAVASMIGSAAVIVLLCLPKSRAWFTTR
jgi:hypothetical protein